MAVVLVTQSADGFDLVHVVPVSTQSPHKGQASIEVPAAVRKHLGLSAERSWIVVDEWNRFTWPGYDIRPIRGREPAISYGFLPAGFFRQVRDALVSAAIGRPVSRDD